MLNQIADPSYDVWRYTDRLGNLQRATGQKPIAFGQNAEIAQRGYRYEPESAYDSYLRELTSRMRKPEDPWAKSASSVGNVSIPQAKNYSGSLGRVSPKDVQLTPEEQTAVALVNSLMTGQYGNLKQLLSGTPDMGLLEMAVLGPSRRNLQEVIIPGIEQQFSGGPYGGSYNTGARRETVARAYSDEATRRAQAMQAETALAKQMGLEATKVLPALTQISGLERQVQEGNEGRRMQASLANMEARFKEMGLNEQALKRSMQIAQMALQKAHMEWQQKTEEQKIGNEMAQFSAQMALKEKELQGNLNIANSRNAIAWNQAVAQERARMDREAEIQRVNLGAADALSTVLNMSGSGSFSNYGKTPEQSMWEILSGASGALGKTSPGLALNMLMGGALNMYLRQKQAAQNTDMLANSNQNGSVQGGV